MRKHSDNGDQHPGTVFVWLCAKYPTMRTTHTDEHITPGRHLSCWLDTAFPELHFDTLKENTETDVVIVGGGIAGLSVAYCLLQTGKRVVLVEDGNIGSGESGHTTAHLTNALDDRYYHLLKLYGKDDTRLIAESHTQAIALIEKIVLQEEIDCDFLRLNGYLFLHPSDKQESLDKELEAARTAGLPVNMNEELPGMKQSQVRCIEFPGQGQFHPIKYLNGLCRAIEKKGGRIFTNTHAKDIGSEGIKTSDGLTVRANHIVIATNTPVNDKYVIHMKQYPYRTYVIGAKVAKGSLPQALWWDTGDMNVNSSIPPYHYVRLQPLDETHDLLICGGEDHATGLAVIEQLPEEERYAQLESWMRAHFEAGEIVYRWSGQVMEPMDSIAFIGRNPMDKDNVYIVTGDSGNGMTHGTIAGMLITDLINGRENPLEKIYDPSRVKWITAGGVFFKEFVGGMFNYLRTNPDTDPELIHTLNQDEGKVIEWQKKKCGIYRDTEDTLHVVDAACTHLQCTIRWNNDEKSWDCPCHGSRFTYKGKVMNGPANEDLSYHAEALDPALKHKA